MYNMIIVDDEKQIRDGLKKMMPWEEYNIQICGEAENGQQALELVEHLHPQIIFTDIRMPVMDGIELLQELKQREETSKVVVLSGYDDFNLIRRAMKNGAMDYLLKPSGKDEILQIVEEIIENFKDDINSKLINNEHLTLLKTNVMSRLIRNDLSRMEMKQKFELLELKLPEGPYSVAVVEIIENGQNQMLGQTFLACEICQDMIERKNRGIVFIDSIGKVVIILSEVKRDNSMLYIKETLDEAQIRIHQDLELDTVISAGSTVKTHRSLNQSYKEAADTLGHQFVFGINCVLFFDEIKEYFEKKNNLPAVEHNEIRNLMQNGSASEADAFVDGVFEGYLKKEVIADQFVLRNCALEMIILAFQYLDENPMIDRTKIQDMKERALKKSASQSSLDLIQKTVKHCFYEIIDLVKESHEDNHSKLVYNMIKRVQQQYSDTELSLSNLAEEFHLNTAYLGRIFKKETNNTFTNYLNEVRIEKAKELLIQTSYKGSELFKEVGFANYNYFYTVFKKRTGKSPMDYRK